MDRDDILRLAQSEKPDHRGDEREKAIFDKSFYWAFIAMGVVATVFACVRNAHGQDPFDIMALIMFSGASAFIFRYIKTKKVMNLVCFGLMLFSAVFATVRFFGSFAG
ncbi:MAG: hypothetical protein IJ071_09075 [Ruminococcus sp.]|nr:hypothetical protein [Ruminococcus sp.]